MRSDVAVYGASGIRFSFDYIMTSNQSLAVGVQRDLWLFPLATFIILVAVA